MLVAGSSRALVLHFNSFVEFINALLGQKIIDFEIFKTVVVIAWILEFSYPEACSVERAPASARLLNNSYDAGLYCSTGGRSRALALMNAALVIISRCPIPP